VKPGSSDVRELFEAIQARDVKRVKAILRKDPGLAKAKDPQGNSALLLAAYVGAPEIADALTGAGAPMTVFEAAALGRADTVRDLLTITPALLHAHAHDGWTLLHLAAFFGHSALARMLLDRGADVGAVSRNAMANTPLHSAVAGRRLETARLLLDRGADPNVPAQGLTPLHLAAHGGHQPLCELLLAFGADTQLVDWNGRTAADLAAEQGHTALAGYLKRF
jgi:ankyrin repeat protein